MGEGKGSDVASTAVAEISILLLLPYLIITHNVDLIMLHLTQLNQAH